MNVTWKPLDRTHTMAPNALPPIGLGKTRIKESNSVAMVTRTTTQRQPLEIVVSQCSCIRTTIILNTANQHPIKQQCEPTFRSQTTRACAEQHASPYTMAQQLALQLQTHRKSTKRIPRGETTRWQRHERHAGHLLKNSRKKKQISTTTLRFHDACDRKQKPKNCICDCNWHDNYSKNITKRHSQWVLHTSTCTQKQIDMNTFSDTTNKKRTQTNRNTTNVAYQQTRPLSLAQHNHCGILMDSAYMWQKFSRRITLELVLHTNNSHNKTHGTTNARNRRTTCRVATHMKEQQKQHEHLSLVVNFTHGECVARMLILH